MYFAGCGDDDVSTDGGPDGSTPPDSSDSGVDALPDMDSAMPDAGVMDVSSMDVPQVDAGGASFVPFFSDGFESYEDGISLSGLVFDAAGNTRASQERAAHGTGSARMAINDDNAGAFGNWGGIIPIRPGLAEGQEVWVRLYVYWPESFEFSAAPWMKFLRLHNADADGENAGYNDLYIHNADGPESVLRTIKEVHNIWAVNDGPPIPRGRWERYEMHLYIDDVSVDDGGEGRVRIWRDGERIFDRTDVPTITGPGGVIDGFYLFTYWNNEMPPNNHCFVDDLTIATSESPPPNRDADGLPVIGEWTAE